MRVFRPGESIKQCRSRLYQARAQAIRAGQPHQKLDKKIAYLESFCDISVSHSNPSPSKYASHSTRFTRPVQGGKVSPR